MHSAGAEVHRLALFPQVSELEASLAAATADAPRAFIPAERPAADSAAAGGVPGSLDTQTVDETRTAGGALAQDSAPQLRPAGAPRAETCEAQPQSVQPSLMELMDTAWHAKPASPQFQARCLQCDQTCYGLGGLFWSCLISACQHLHRLQSNEARCPIRLRL